MEDKKAKSWVIAADMGYGHQRTAYPLRDMVPDKFVINANHYIGIPKKDITLNFGKYFIDKELTIKGVFGRRIWETWEQMSELLLSNKVDLTKMIKMGFATFLKKNIT